MELRMLIDGALVDGAGRMEVINPATGSVLALAPLANAAYLEIAVASAQSAFRAWADAGYDIRRSHLLALADAIERRADDFARLLTQEQGKILRESTAEVAGAVAALRYFASQELTPETLRYDSTSWIIETRRPLGVVAAIMPWNYPVLMLALKIAPALITGNTVIAKPAPTTPLTTLLFGEMAAEILPRGVFQTLVDQNDLGSLLTAHPGVAFVSFTGSTATGQKVLKSTVDTLKRFSLELGGNDAALVLDDAPIDVIAPQIFHGAMKNAGQICLAIKRVYAPRAMIDPLCAELARLSRQTVLGDGLDSRATMGPVNNVAQYEKLIALIDTAKVQGRIVAGGEVPQGSGYFIEPTIVRDLPDGAALVQEEQFGPVLPVLAYDDLGDAISRINASNYGLGGTIWTADVERGIATASLIDSGTVWVNKHLDLPFEIPMGGAKQSGFGRQQGIEGMKEFTQPTVINAAAPGPRSSSGSPAQAKTSHGC